MFGYDFYDFLGGVRERIGRCESYAAFGKHFPAEFDICAFEPYDERKCEPDVFDSRDYACRDYIEDKGSLAAANWFRAENDPSFLWIKNVWYPDVSYAHPIQDYDEFSKSFSKNIILANGQKAAIGTIIDAGEYENLTAHLGEEKEQANGYFILIVVTIGLMVLQQFIMMKSQKEANQYQTVDGQGARTQKIMMVMLPLIYAITGLMWTAAFSIYIAVSSIIGILVTLISNFFIDRSFRRKEEAELIAKYRRKAPSAVQPKNKKQK